MASTLAFCCKQSVLFSYVIFMKIHSSGQFFSNQGIGTVRSNVLSHILFVRIFQIYLNSSSFINLLQFYACTLDGGFSLQARSLRRPLYSRLLATRLSDKFKRPSYPDTQQIRKHQAFPPTITVIDIMIVSAFF